MADDACKALADPQPQNDFDEPTERDGQTLATSFAVDDAHAEFKRLRELGVRFTQEPVKMGTVTTAVLDDTCGNLIQIHQQ
ncbi:VOC family protein [Sphaerisporangium fuscum]|uniref:VOC family protein n=1 Tax=Sphaerisporangium fuscum TaxID=2835868 RepID=UPI003556F915